MRRHTASLSLLKLCLHHRSQQLPLQCSDKYLITLKAIVHNPYLALKLAASASTLKVACLPESLSTFSNYTCLSNKRWYLNLQTLPCLLLQLYFTTNITHRDRHSEEEHETAGEEQNTIIMPKAPLS